ncbi:MAG: hypothetical protein LJE70_19335, partial [Chromatiaceae bacterium]|nr:hypothetical protein [Chromatiaceae bacterium]
YPDKAQDEIRPQGDTLMAQKIIKSALVPSQAGKLTLPEVRLAWWDTKTNKPQVASLPERSVDVLPAVAGVSATSFAAGSASAEPIAEPALPAAEVGPVAPVSADTGGGTDLSNLGEALTGESRVTAGYWPWVAAAFALAWLATAVLWLRARRGGRVPAAAAPPAPPDLSKARAQLKTACSAGDARVARQALLYWAAARWPLDPPRRLETLAWRLNGDAAEVLRELDRGLYAGAEPPWDGASAWRRLAPSLGKEPREQAGSGQHSPLPPLYPQHA